MVILDEQPLSQEPQEWIFLVNFGLGWSGDWIDSALATPALAIVLVPPIALASILAAMVVAPPPALSPTPTATVVLLRLALVLILAATLLAPPLVLPLVLTLATPPSRVPASCLCYLRNPMGGQGLLGWEDLQLTGDQQETGTGGRETQKD